MTPAELLREVKRIELTTRELVRDLVAGDYTSTFRGRGVEFAEVREYLPGDDVRTIDWNVTARMNDAHVKVFTEERELTVMLLVDVSASEEFGSQARAKAETAAEVAAQIAFSAIANNDRVGLVLFSDRVEKVVPPRKGRKHVLRVVSDILSCRPQHRGTDISQALMWLSHAVRRKTVTFLISDFLASGYEQAMRIVSRKHDLVPVVVFDPLEEKFPSMGLLELMDPETEERWLVDTSDPRIRGHFAKEVKKRKEERTKQFRKLQLDHIELSSSKDHSLALQQFFQARASRRAS